MKLGKVAAAVAVMGLVAPSTIAAVNTPAAAPIANGARVGATMQGRQSNMTSENAILAALAAAAAGAGVAAAAGAFDGNHHRPVSP
jgi:hypothetical protein